MKMFSPKEEGIRTIRRTVSTKYSSLGIHTYKTDGWLAAVVATRGAGGAAAEREINRERQRENETEREREKETERATDRQTDRQTERQTDRQTDRDTDTDDLFILGHCPR